MGARNFSIGNASKIFTMFFPVEVDNHDADGKQLGEVQYEHPESWQIEEEIENIKNLLEELPYSDFDIERGNSETGIVGLKLYKNYGDVEVGVEILCFLEHGYHEGARLDWEINFVIDGVEYEGIDLATIQNEFNHSSNLPKGMQRILSKKALVWIDRTKSKMIEEVEDIYDKVSGLKLKLEGVFSNGEAIYSEID